jgi:hypothetical protein
MAEIKNTFLQSKMNQDVDDRIVPQGEYRSAQNISVSRSEGSDVGALQTILGNSLATSTSILPNIRNLDIIGQYSDSTTNNFYIFLTDYVDSSPSGVDNFAPTTANCFIYRVNVITKIYDLLVTGYWLNFSKNSPISGINILENLLFWTDNRNQPRKINIDSAFASPTTYYTNEDHVSVAKYAPLLPLQLLDVKNDNWLKSTMTNPSQEDLNSAFNATAVPNPDYDDTWGGDPQYLTDRFVRFSYRFKFDDGEYSIIAPYTQTCFIPKQQGYFNETDSVDTYKSTIVAFMENNVAQIGLNIIFPTGTPKTDLHISEVDILFRQSTSNSIKVVQTIPIEDIENAMGLNVLNNVYEFKYISTKPYRTLPADQSIRVYDKVPIKALSQEIISNRIVYGNYLDKHTSPVSLNYGLGYGDKPMVAPSNNIAYSQIEYPSSSVKQNRNYQAGVVLSDRYGRQSSVILSTRDSGSKEGGNILYGGSTVYVPYLPDNGVGAADWPGYSLKVLFVNATNSSTAIPLTGPAGYPGIYKDASYSVDGIVKDSSGSGYLTAGTNVLCEGGSGSGLTVDYTVNAQSIDTVTIHNPGIGYQNGDKVTIKNGLNTGDATLALTVNPPNLLGWYSYKLVVRQTEQDYYNVYLPGILKGFPRETNPAIPPTPPDGKTANIVLFNDNINKVPRDLVEVGPDQKQYRSSVQLFGRVAPFLPGTTVDSNLTMQYYPGTLSDIAVSISTLRETNYVHESLNLADDYPEFYQAQTNPLIARVSTSNAIGKPAKTTGAPDYIITLGVYETAPVESLLDIYWETSTVGIVSDLNNSVSQEFFGPAKFKIPSGTVYTQSESYAKDTVVISGVTVLDKDDAEIQTPIGYQLVLVKDGNGVDVTDRFKLQASTGPLPSYFSIKTDDYFYFGDQTANNNLARSYTFYISCFDAVSNSSVTLNLAGSLSNANPVFTSVPLNNQLVLPNAGPLVYEFTGENGVNQSDDIINRTKGLTWTLVSVLLNGINVTNTADFILSNSGTLTNPSFVAVDVINPYTITIRLTDDGGASTDYSFTTQYFEAVSGKFFRSQFYSNDNYANPYTVFVSFKDLGSPNDIKYSQQLTAKLGTIASDVFENEVDWPPFENKLTATCIAGEENGAGGFVPEAVPAGFELVVTIGKNSEDTTDPSTGQSFSGGSFVNYSYEFEASGSDDNFIIIAELLSIQVPQNP